MKRPDGKLYSTGYQANRLNVVRALYRFLRRNGLTLHDPASTIETPRLGKPLPKDILTPREAARILDAASDDSPRTLRDRAMLETLYCTVSASPSWQVSFSATSISRSASFASTRARGAGRESCR
jgi:site-specific recombinase XerD